MNISEKVKHGVLTVKVLVQSGLYKKVLIITPPQKHRVPVPWGSHFTEYMEEIREWLFQGDVESALKWKTYPVDRRMEFDTSKIWFLEWGTYFAEDWFKGREFDLALFTRNDIMFPQILGTRMRGLQPLILGDYTIED